MLYWLLYEKLHTTWGPLRLFGYVTFRIALASLLAMLIVLVFGPAFIAWLRRFQIGQFIREE